MYYIMTFIGSETMTFSIKYPLSYPLLDPQQIEKNKNTGEYFSSSTSIMIELHICESHYPAH